MTRKTDITQELRRIFGKAACILLALLIVIMMPASDYAFAADSNAEKPKREVHKVAIEDKLYCFFVTHYVVLTPEEIAAMNDEELTGEIFKQSGLYMKEANCHAKAHKAITPADWAKGGGRFFLKDSDIESIRQAAPVDGDPVKLQMDLRITTKAQEENRKKDAEKPEETPKPDDADNPENPDNPDEPETPDEPEESEPADDKPKDYSTFKRTSPRLIFIAVATETDAVYGEELCEEEKTPAKPADNKKAAPSGAIKGSDGGGGEASEMLPEYRTISMPDRSGGKLDPTLEDGKPVTLEWKDPKKHVGDVDGKTFLDRIPGGAAGLTVIGITLAGLIAAAVIAIRKNREEEY